MHKNQLGRFIPNGKTVTQDHQVTTFVVTVRHMNTVGPETIKDLIQRKFEVTNIEQVDKITFVR